MTIVSVDNAKHGTFTIENGKVKFVPETDFVGTATATYKVSDGKQESAETTITVTVEPYTGNEKYTITQAFEKECSEGEKGSSVLYTGSGTATATANTQAEADEQALAQAKTQAENDVTTNGQANANTNGTCTQNVFEGNGEYTATKEFVKSNCEDGFKGTSVPFSHTETATATAKTQEKANKIAQAFAFKKAQEFVDNNGQANADANGECIQVVFDGTTEYTGEKVVTRNNCKNNFKGTSVTLSHTENGSATGSTQEKANALAELDARKKVWAYLEANAQNYANENGECKPTVFTGTGTATATGKFTKNDCNEDSVGTEVEISKTVTTTATTGSQEDADALAGLKAKTEAQAQVDAEGQENANENGTCIVDTFHATKEFTAKGMFTKECGENETGTKVEITHTETATETGSTQEKADALALAKARE